MRVRIKVSNETRKSKLSTVECVFVDVNRQDEGKSANLCVWINIGLPASSVWAHHSWLSPHSNCSLSPPPLSLSLILYLIAYQFYFTAICSVPTETSNNQINFQSKLPLTVFRLRESESKTCLAMDNYTPVTQALGWLSVWKEALPLHWTLATTGESFLSQTLVICNNYPENEPATQWIPI